MSEKFKIYSEFIKDLSSETKDLETYLYVKEYLKNYNLNIEISSKPLKNRFIEVNTKLTYVDNSESKSKAFFEIIYATIVKIDEQINDRKIIEKIILCEVQNKIYNNLEKVFINLLRDSGYPGAKIEKKIDFEKLYNQKLS
jgi:preprotein translocase subunit SecB|tara:strand:- start:1408 stop:1830 length:423 start_codon:yes stop_codon:yes gene_type:complete